MTIKEIEYRSGLPRASVRYYEEQGLLFPTRAANGYRDYSQDDLTALLKIKLLRELDCSLEDILALQRGELELPQLLERQLDTLDARGAALERAKSLCVQLRQEGVTYAQLDPQRYLDALPAPAWDATQDQTPRHPWRRFFARSLDLTLYGLLFRLFRTLVLGQSNLNRPAGDAFAVALIAAALALALEPAFLHFWGTTPGKWAMRLRLTGDDGRPLPYSHALERTAKVLLFGDCLGLPLAGHIANLLAYRRDRQGRKQPWEREDELYQDMAPRGRFVPLLAVLLWAVYLALAVGLLAGAEWQAARLPYPSPQTVAQFAANYDHILRYQSSGYVAPEQLLTDQGTLGDAVPGPYAVYSLGQPPTFHYETDSDGQLTAVTLDWDATFTGLWYYPGDYMARTLQALEGDRALFFSDRSPLYRRCQALCDGDGNTLHALPPQNWLAQLELEATGCHLETDHGLFVSDTPGQDGKQRVVLRLRLTSVSP